MVNVTEKTKQALAVSEERKRQPSKIDIFAATIMSDMQKRQFAMALPAHLKKNEERYLRSYLTQVRMNPKLLNCNQGSLFGAMMTGAALGLDPSPQLGQFHLVPYKDECTFIIGYHGMIALAYRGDVKKIWAHEVCEHDEFNMEWGLKETLHHKPKFDGDRGKVIGYYAAAVLPNDEVSFVYMTRTEIEKYAKKYSKAYTSGPWNDPTQFDSMAKKTALRQLFKWIPKSTELAVAISKEGGITEINPKEVGNISSETVLEAETVYEEEAEEGVEGEPESERGLTNPDQETLVLSNTKA